MAMQIEPCASILIHVTTPRFQVARCTLLTNWKMGMGGGLTSRSEPGKKTSMTSTAMGNQGAPQHTMSQFGEVLVYWKTQTGAWNPTQDSLECRGQGVGIGLKAKTSLASCIPNPGTSTVVRVEGASRKSKVKPANRHCKPQLHREEYGRRQHWGHHTVPSRVTQNLSGRLSP